MAAYNDTCGLVYLDEQATKITGKAKYETQKRSNSGNDQRHKEFDNKRDCIVTATIEAAEDLKRKLANRIGAEATTRVRTMASVLVNGFKEHTQPSPNRRGYDEPLWRNNNGRSAGQGQGTAA
ncbi:hypothetical protein EVAR_91650_1 [Eumeta japonica]|uniref:Uncharacterized protein n=1 Tax=Eumeta variegata TaxID=151549 RepID=A0A4C1Z7E4_EUMVA|nr:hypothetical protein EVAR_91650_1 [Eumeta japonica]